MATEQLSQGDIVVITSPGSKGKHWEVVGILRVNSKTVVAVITDGTARILWFFSDLRKVS